MGYSLIRALRAMSFFFHPHHKIDVIQLLHNLINTMLYLISLQGGGLKQIKELTRVSN